MTPGLVATVLVAGAVGSVARYLVALAFPHDAGRSTLPWGVLIVNGIGSLLAGLLIGLAGASAVSTEFQLVLVTGFCGGLTTFSTLSVESIQLIERGRWRTAIASIGLNLIVGISLAAIGYTLV